MRRINDEVERRAPVTLERWSSPLEGTYEDSPAATTGRSRDEVAEETPAPPAEAAVPAEPPPAPAPGPAPAGLRSEATREGGASGGPGARASGASANIAVDLVKRVRLTRRVSLVKKVVDRRDRWAAFAPTPMREPGWFTRVLERIGRVLAHEVTLAALGSALLAVVMTWPALRHPTRTVPHDLGDPLAQAWRLAWPGHALKTDPSGLWNGNTFYPERYSFAFADPLLGYAPSSLLGTGVGAALLRYNVVFTFAFALAFFGGYLLVRQLGASRGGAAVAAAAFAFAPWRWGQSGHLQMLSTGGIALALALLARGHGYSLRKGYQPHKARPGWALVGWLVAAWQISLGLSLGLPFAYVIAAIGLVAAGGWVTHRNGRRGLAGWWASRPKFSFWLLLADTAGGATFLAAAAAVVFPYVRVIQEHPDAWRARTLHVPPAHGFLIAPPDSWLWGDRHANLRASLSDPVDTSFLLGYALIALALAGLVYSVWSPYIRRLLMVGLVLSVMAPQAFPQWNKLHSPAGLAPWATLFAGLLAAGAVSALSRRARAYVADRDRARPGPLLRLAMVLPLALVLVEGVSVGAHPAVPGPPPELRTVEAPMLILPTGQGHDELVMLWSVDGFGAVVNGGGEGFTPERLVDAREGLKTFPDEVSVELLRELGVLTVVIVKARVGGTPYAGASKANVEELDIEREETRDLVIFRL